LDSLLPLSTTKEIAGHSLHLVPPSSCYPHGNGKSRQRVAEIWKRYIPKRLLNRLKLVVGETRLGKADA